MEAGRKTSVGRMLAVFGCLICAGLGLAPNGAAATAKPCNGHPALCSRPFDRVVLPGSHNSMSAEELGWVNPNQLWGIPGQLRRGARAFLIDTHYGEAFQFDGETVVRNISKEQGLATGAEVYLCHALCNLGATRLVDEFRRIRDFLKANPREVVLFLNEDYVGPEDFAERVASSGLLPYVYRGPVGADEWPTLGQMVSSDQRVVFLTQGDAGDVPWYHRAYDGPMRETPYSFGSAEELSASDRLVESCQPNRGGEVGGLFLMNHWVLIRGVTPSREIATTINSKEALLARARACEGARGKLPTILAVDFFGVGDTVGAARELNGVGPWSPPKLTARQIRSLAIRRCRAVRPAGRRACIRRQVMKITRSQSRR